MTESGYTMIDRYKRQPNIYQMQMPQLLSGLASTNKRESWVFGAIDKDLSTMNYCRPVKPSLLTCGEWFQKKRPVLHNRKCTSNLKITLLLIICQGYSKFSKITYQEYL